MESYLPGQSAIEDFGVALSIFLIIYLIRRRWKMYFVMPVAVATLALTGGSIPGESFALLYRSATSHTAFYLVSMVVSITVLGSLHRRAGAMNRLVDSVRLLIRDPRALLMIFPASISLFSTVPGGAIISAPMVEETGRELKMPPVELAMSNMVYRHLVVLITPFNAGLILASAISGISIAGYLGFTVPVIAIVFAIAAAILYARYPAPDKSTKEPGKVNRLKALAELLVSSSPFILAIVLGLACGLFFPLAVLIGCAACLFLYLPQENKGRSVVDRLKSIFTDFNWELALSTLTIVLYKDFMLEADSFLQAVHFLVERGMPLMVLIVIVPFITGFITGNNAAALGVAMPILIPFLGPEMLSVRYFGILYLSSYAGYLGSPVHLCTFVTNEYFKTELYQLIKGVNIYAAIMLAVGLALSFLYS